MDCRNCGSAKQKEFPSEVNIHPPRGLKYLSNPCVFAFPQLLVCLDCGFTEFVLEETERGELAQHYSGEIAAEPKNDAESMRARRTAASKLN